MGKFDKYYHHAKFDIYHIYRVQENCNVIVFATNGQSASHLSSQQSIYLAGLTLIITKTHIFHASQKPQSYFGMLCKLQPYEMGSQVKMHVGSNMCKECKYFYLQVFCGFSSNICATEVLFSLDFQLLRVHLVSSFFTNEEQKKKTGL